MDEVDKISAETFIFKPVPIIWLILLKALPMAFRGGIMGGILGGALIYITMNLINCCFKGFFSSLIFAGSLSFLVTFFMIVIVRLKTLQETTYYCDVSGVEYREGFWTLEKKRMDYSVITSIEIRRTLIQRWYGIGTVYLTVPALAPRGSLNAKGLGGLLKKLFLNTTFNFAGIALEDIRDPEMVYAWLRDRLSK